MRTAMLFPGQGAQRAGMLATLPRHDAVVSTLAEASDVLNRDWRELDRQDALASTEATQLALLIAGVAAARAFLAEGARIDAVLGHSVGAYPAAVTAGCLSLRDALKLVALRGSLMASIHPSGFGMAAIVGLRQQVVAELVDAAAGPIYLANRNAPLQTVVSGSNAALESVCARALEIGASKAERLNVTTPSHSPLVAPVAEALREAVRSVEFHVPRLAYASSRSARLLNDAAAIAEDLACNVAEPVLWDDAVAMLVERGASVFLQVPPGTVLADLVTQAHPAVRVYALEGGTLGSAVHLTR